MSTIATIYFQPTFFESYSNLSKSDQHRVNQTLKKIKNDSSGLRLHKVGDKKSSFVSISASMDLRVLCTQWKEGLVLNYVDHHDKAYSWGEKHSVIVNEKSSFFEFLPSEINDRDSNKIEFDDSKHYGKRITANLPKGCLPTLLVKKLETIDSEDILLQFLQNLSPSFQEIILNAATGSVSEGNFNASSRVIVINDDEELERALKYPLEYWRLFLHPLQRNIIEQDCMRKIAVIGGPGTGKTIVLVHRAVRLSKENKNVLFITKTNSLARIILELINKLTDKHNIIVAYFPEAQESHDLWVQGNELGYIDKSIPPPYKIRLLTRATDNKMRTGVSISLNHILFDEAQDLFNSNELLWLNDLLQMNTIGTTFSIDINQTVYPSFPDGILNLLYDSKIKVETLSYSYRSTKEIIKYAKDLSERAKRIHSGLISAKVDNADSLINRAQREIDTLPSGLKQMKSSIEKVLSSRNHLHAKKIHIDRRDDISDKKKIITNIKKKRKELKKQTEELRKKIRDEKEQVKIGSQNKEQLKQKLVADKEMQETTLEAMPLFSKYPIFYGLAGSPVIVKSCSETNISYELSDAVNELTNLYDKNNVVIIVPDMESASHYIRGISEDIAIETYKSSKGQEWFGGIVIANSSVLTSLKSDSTDCVPDFNVASAIYVAITRFREKVILLSVQDR